MLNIKINNVNFRGQYADALKALRQGQTVDIHNFFNSGWEATTQIWHFKNLLEKAKIPVIMKHNQRNAIRSYVFQDPAYEQ